eukprot:1146016-Pelagomonas_calceolata.AAC.12
MPFFNCQDLKLKIIKGYASHKAAFQVLRLAEVLNSILLLQLAHMQASLVCPLISRLTPALRHLTAATSSLQALANATLQQHLQRFKPHATSSTTQRGHVRGEGAGAAGMHNQQLDTKQRLLQAVQGAGVDVQTGGQAARRLPPSVPAGSQLRWVCRVGAKGQCKRRLLRTFCIAGWRRPSLLGHSFSGYAA